MNIALIGATGFVGSAVLSELLRRGHKVTALARTPAKLAAQPGLTIIKADVLHASQVESAVRGTDAVVDAYNPGWKEENIHDLFLQGTRAIYDGVRASGVKRLLVVGGAGSLYAAPGLQIVDTPDFPAAYKQGALAAREALNLIRKEDSLEWTFLSPPILLTPGERQGRPYRVEADVPLMDGDKPGTITVADLALAIVDEIETGKHIRKRFTVAY